VVSYYDYMEIGSAGPISPTISIADGSVVEGKRGTQQLTMKVKLSWVADHQVSLRFATVDGTALAKSDYKATSGTVTFQPGETTRTLSIAINGDPKREPNETFSVGLSNVVGATISDGVAIATIVNDD